MAVQACEAAAACISRPSSPQDTAHPPIPDKEIAVRVRLEDLIDQVHVLFVTQHGAYNTLLKSVLLLDLLHIYAVVHIHYIATKKSMKTICICTVCICICN